MKLFKRLKLAKLTVILIIICILAGCGNSNNANSNSNNNLDSQIAATISNTDILLSNAAASDKAEDNDSSLSNIIESTVSNNIELPENEIGVDVNSTLEVAALDVGKGDAIVVTNPEFTVIIDTGYNNTTDAIKNYLAEKNITNIDCLIITHYDKDHVGGADFVLENYNVKQVIAPNYVSDSKQYTQYIKALEECGITPNNITEVTKLQFSDVTFTIYPPQQKKYNGDNDYSLVTSIIHGDNHFLFAGDAEKVRIQELINSKMNLQHTFLKVPHHGWGEDNSSLFFSQVQPEYAVITCSADQGADESVVQTLENMGVKVYYTRDGNIICNSDGKTLYF